MAEVTVHIDQWHGDVFGVGGRPHRGELPDLAVAACAAARIFEPALPDSATVSAVVDVDLAIVGDLVRLNDQRPVESHRRVRLAPDRRFTEPKVAQVGGDVPVSQRGHEAYGQRNGQAHVVAGRTYRYRGQ